MTIRRVFIFGGVAKERREYIHSGQIFTLLIRCVEGPGTDECLALGRCQLVVLVRTSIIQINGFILLNVRSVCLMPRIPFIALFVFSFAPFFLFQSALLFLPCPMVLAVLFPVLCVSCTSFVAHRSPSRFWLLGRRTWFVIVF